MIKTLLRIWFFLLYVSFTGACHKDPGTNNAISAGSLKTDSSYQCLPAIVKGEYSTDSILTSENYIDLQVQVSLAGTYSIQTEVTNGYSFKGSGTFGVMGLNTVRLYGSGTPLLAGINSFVVRYGNSLCVLDIEVMQSGRDAVFTLAGAGGTCSGAILQGNYMAGVATSQANSVEIFLNVTTTGNYNLSTTEVNGITFSATGIFTDATSQTVVLNAHGTPLTPGTFNFPLFGNSSSCAFSVTFL